LGCGLEERASAPAWSIRATSRASNRRWSD
jgi:hypothetical protein